MLLKKKLLVFGVAAIMAVASCFMFSGCSGKEEVKKSDASQEVSVESAAELNSDAAEPVGEEATVEAPVAVTDAAEGETKAPEETKYGNAEVYTNENGKPAAKTESGVEVELTSENMGKLIEDYQAVQGSGSDEEKALLDQIQVLLEVSQNQEISE